MQGGKCGICGDPYQGPRDHEAGGKYASGVIVKTYRQGAAIPVTVDITGKPTALRPKLMNDPIERPNGSRISIS